MPVNKGTIIYNSNFLFSDSDTIASFECENFVSNALNNYTIATISNEYVEILNCFTEPIKNSHDSEVVDTIYTFSNPDNIIQIYRSNHADFIFTFDVTDSLFMLTGNIGPGMTKDLFFQKFHITKISNDNVQILNSEGSVSFMFSFQNNRLKRINSYSYLD